MSKIFRLESIQMIPGSIEEVWQFFSDARNLLAITPPFLGLRVRNKEEPKPIHKGQRISYVVRPLFGIPLSWLTEITEVDQPYMFVDEQLKGPYRLWRHRHIFREVEGGVEMKDIVEYQLPFGVLGRMFHPLIVKGKLHQIFNYRYQVICGKYGTWPGASMQLKFD